MTMASFLLRNNLERVRFYKKTFLLANTSIEMILEMSLLSLSNTDV